MHFSFWLFSWNHYCGFVKYHSNLCSELDTRPKLRGFAQSINLSKKSLFSEIRLVSYMQKSNQVSGNKELSNYCKKCVWINIEYLKTAPILKQNQHKTRLEILFYITSAYVAKSLFYQNEMQPIVCIFLFFPRQRWWND